jgi:hypothetical protein
MTRHEVAFLHNFGCVESTIRFAPGRVLSYSVASLTDAAEVSVRYQDNSICVVLLRPVVTAWAEGTAVTVEGSRESGVQVLVEKDFQCLHKPEERDPEAYPHPLAAA